MNVQCACETRMKALIHRVMSSINRNSLSHTYIPLFLLCEVQIFPWGSHSETSSVHALPLLFNQVSHPYRKISTISHGIYKLYNEPDVMKVIKVGRLGLLGHLFRMQEENPCRKLNLHKQEVTRRVGRFATRF